MDSMIVLSTFAVLGGLYAISAQQLMRGVLGLAVFFAALAGIFGQLGAWYLAVGQLFLFVGGVVTLFVLAFNFTTVTISREKAFIPALLFVVVLAVISLFLPSSSPVPPEFSLAVFAKEFFASYGWFINLALLLLFSAIISAQYILEDS